MTEDKRAEPFFPAQCQRKEIDTSLVECHLFTHPFINPWTPTHYRRGCQNRYGWYHITDMWGTSPEWKIVDKFVCFIYNTYYIVYIYIGLCSYIFEYILDYILHYIYVVGRIRNTKEQNTKCQSSHHDTTSIITPRHHNTQFNDNQVWQIRR